MQSLVCWDELVTNDEAESSGFNLYGRDDHLVLTKRNRGTA